MECTVTSQLDYKMNIIITLCASWHALDLASFPGLPRGEGTLFAHAWQFLKSPTRVCVDRGHFEMWACNETSRNFHGLRSLAPMVV